MQKTELASRIKFQDAQSANLAAEAAIHDKQLHNMDQEAQDAHNAASLEQFKGLQALGLTPTLVVGNNHGGAEAKAGLEQLTANQGAVPPMFTINLGHQIVGFDLNQLTQAPQGLDAVNKMRQVTNPGATPIDQKTWATMPKQMQVDQLNAALNFTNPTPNEQNLATYKNYVTTLQAQPDSPDKAAKVAQFQGIVDRMQKGLDSMNTRANAQNAAKEGAVEQAKVAADNSPTAIAGARAKAEAEAAGKNAADKAAFGNITDPFGVGTFTAGNDVGTIAYKWNVVPSGGSVGTTNQMSASVTPALQSGVGIATSQTLTGFTMGAGDFISVNASASTSNQIAFVTVVEI